jgi:hypothetical protein
MQGNFGTKAASFQIGTSYRIGKWNRSITGAGLGKIITVFIPFFNPI